MLPVLLTLLLLASAQAAPASPPISHSDRATVHRLGRSTRLRSLTPLIPPRLRRAVGRLSGSRMDARESVKVEPHEIPDSGEVWELSDREYITLENGYVIKAEMEGRRVGKMGEDIISKAWTDLVSSPSATSVVEGEGDRRSWFEGEYIGELGQGRRGSQVVIALQPEEDELAGTPTRGWMSYLKSGASEADSYPPSIFSSVLESTSPRFRIGAVATPPTEGWAVNPHGEWYLVHLD